MSRRPVTRNMSNRPDDLGLSPVSWRQKAEIIT
jgi:hypothetical protein